MLSPKKVRRDSNPRKNIDLKLSKVNNQRSKENSPSRNSQELVKTSTAIDERDEVDEEDTVDSYQHRITFSTPLQAQDDQVQGISEQLADQGLNGLNQQESQHILSETSR